MNIARTVLASSDPVFAALCRHALEGTPLELVAAVAPAELLESIRRLEPDLLILDADSEDFATLRALAAKVMLVSDARVMLVGAYLALGSPALGALLQAIPAGFVLKPQGPSSLGLAGDDAASFADAVAAAHEGSVAEPAPEPSARPRSATIPPAAVDDGWDVAPKTEPGVKT